MDLQPHLTLNLHLRHSNLGACRLVGWDNLDLPSDGVTASCQSCYDACQSDPSCVKWAFAGADLSYYSDNVCRE